MTELVVVGGETRGAQQSKEVGRSTARNAAPRDTGSSSPKIFCKGFPLKNNMKAAGATRNRRSAQGGGCGEGRRTEVDYERS